MKFIKLFIAIIFISFFGTVILSVSGYYQTELQKRTTLTEEAIENFERDIEEGKDIDITNYLENQKKNYDNRFSKSGRDLSNKLNKWVSNGIKKTLKIIIKAIEE